MTTTPAGDVPATEQVKDKAAKKDRKHKKKAKAQTMAERIAELASAGPRSRPAAARRGSTSSATRAR